MASKTKPARPNSVMKWHTSDAASDLAIEIGDESFAGNKFLLISRSGRIRRKVMEANESTPSRIALSEIPGGAEAFELVVRFCYGGSVEITLLNAAMLRCAAYYLEMTEEFGENNLENQTEAYLKQVLSSIPNSIAVLHACESLLPVSEDIHLVSRLIDAIAEHSCREYRLEEEDDDSIIATPRGNSLDFRNLEFFDHVVAALRSKGLRQETVTRVLINYTHKSLQNLIIRDSIDFRMKERIVVEQVVGLLPSQSRNSVPVAFLVSLLKHALASSSSSSCISDLERRIGLQLDQLTFEDMLVLTTFDENGNYPRYETDSISRIFTIFLKLDEDGEDNLEENDDADFADSPQQSSILQASKLLDSYLAEIALDPNLIGAKFVSLAELLPDHARNSCDGLYRAVDAYLKVHPSISDSDRRRLCKTIECRKLSQEACSHAAQNERLPVQMAVQVLYYEQSRMRNEMSSGQSSLLFNSIAAPFPQRSAGSAVISTKDDYASVRRENRELKLEVARMRVRLTELEKDHISMKHEFLKSNPSKKMIRNFAKKFGKLHELFHVWDHRKIGEG